MENFQFNVGTNILFGKGQLEKLPAVLEPFGKRVLLTYGGGSIKRTGLYDRVKALLADFEVFELGGIDPNPRVESVEAGAKICRENGIDVILAVGGGSTIDCSKAIAAATFYDGSAWEMIKKASASRGMGVIDRAVPICTVLTLAATGSEMNSGSVISNLQTKEKIGFSSPLTLPKCSILDPENTFSVPANQTAAGAADIMSHVLEVYFGRTPAFIPDRICEGLLKTVIQYAPVAMKEPENYEARANLMWASSLALNGLCGAGRAGLDHPPHRARTLGLLRYHPRRGPGAADAALDALRTQRCDGEQVCGIRRECVGHRPQPGSIRDCQPGHRRHGSILPQPWHSDDSDRARHRGRIL